MPTHERGDRNYKMRSEAPPPLSPGNYAELVRRNWDAVLETDGLTEAHVHRFLEQHPCLLPFADGLGPEAHGRGSKSTLFAVVSEPVLPGIERPRPDFLRINQDSEAVYPILIEIESPGKAYARKDGQPTAEYTQAIAQIGDWKAWFAQPQNIVAFTELYRIEAPSPFHRRVIEPRFVLVYGRRAELDGNPRARALRAALKPAETTVMTYDRLFPSERASFELCVRLVGRDLRAITISPTLLLGPVVADELAAIKGKPEALDESPYFTDKRRDFLRERFEYWDRWSEQRSGPRFFGADDLE